MLFKLYRRRGFARAVVQHAVDALDLVDDTVSNCAEQRPGKLRRFGSHEVGRRYGADDYCIVVCSLVAHASYGAHVGQRCEILIRILSKPALAISSLKIASAS